MDLFDETVPNANVVYASGHFIITVASSPLGIASVSFSTIVQNSNGQLDKNEYRSCLLSLGYKLGNDHVSL